MKRQFKIIKQEKSAIMLMDRISDPLALHVLLSSPNLPNHYIIHDGKTFWMFNALAENGWENRKEFKGSTQTLEVCSATAGATIASQLDFKLRKIDAGYCFMTWQQYNRVISNVSF